MRREVEDYLVVQEIEKGDLTMRVRKKLKEGWQPLGAPVVTGKLLAQALVKYHYPDG